MNFFQFCFFLITLGYSFLCNASQFSLTKQVPENKLAINTDFNKLCSVANNTLAYRQLGNQYDPDVNHANKLNEFGITSNDIEKTLSKLCDIVKEDKQKSIKRLNDIAYLTRHFDFYRITSDTQHAASLSKQKPLLANLTADKVLMTKCYVHLAKGSLKVTDDTPYALYALPFDEQSLTIEQADAQKQSLTRFHYGKQTILKGVFDTKKRAPVLVYLSREDLESALLQGTIVVEVAGELRVYNVHRNNGIAYDRQIKPYLQERYWYFKQVDGILGYGKDANNKIEVFPEVTFAGDIFQLGLGPLVFAQFDFKSHSEYRMAVMADTGGAFENNLYQLDYLAGSYPGIKAYYNANRHMPDYIDAWFMIYKGENQND